MHTYTLVAGHLFNPSTRPRGYAPHSYKLTVSHLFNLCTHLQRSCTFAAGHLFNPCMRPRGHAPRSWVLAASHFGLPMHLWGHAPRSWVLAASHFRLPTHLRGTSCRLLKYVATFVKSTRRSVRQETWLTKWSNLKGNAPMRKLQKGVRYLP
jgi:hypothetical protein